MNFFSWDELETIKTPSVISGRTRENRHYHIHIYIRSSSKRGLSSIHWYGAGACGLAAVYHELLHICWYRESGIRGILPSVKRCGHWYFFFSCFLRYTLWPAACRFWFSTNRPRLQFASSRPRRPCRRVRRVVCVMRNRTQRRRYTPKSVYFTGRNDSGTKVSVPLSICRKDEDIIYTCTRQRKLGPRKIMASVEAGEKSERFETIFITTFFSWCIYVRHKPYSVCNGG